MDNEYTFGEEFANYMLTNIPGSKLASGGRELVCRCKYCNDSSSLDHGHFYIKIPKTSKDPVVFHCFKCHTSGLVSSQKLLEWGIYSPVLGVKLDTANKNLSLVNKNYTQGWYTIFNSVSDLDLANIKLAYINNRLGTKLTIQDCLSDKIILNLADVLNHNMIKEYTRAPSIIEQLNRYFVGFLSLDNNFVNMRRICDEGVVYSAIDKRYINYDIHGKKDNTEKMYIMPTMIDLSLPTKVQIHIAEGAFDILSIKHNLRGDSMNSIFAAITGSGYKGLLLHIINSFKIFYFDLHVYPDNDKHGNQNMINELIELVKPLNCTLYEHRNVSEGEKDFGVPLNRIKERVTKYN